MITIYGNTYPIKEEIKKRGGKWNKDLKAWQVPEQYVEEIKSMIPKDTINLSGQLWEECEICGREPIYMSHGCCENCAIKGYRR